MPCTVSRDEHGALYRVPEFLPKEKNTSSIYFHPHIDVWWDRDGKDMSNEDVIIRQENGADRADVLCLTLGQVYDLIHALGCLVMDK